MAEKLELEYEVSVTGLGEAAITAENASRSANQASLALTGARSSSSRTLPIMLMSVRSMNAARLAVEQTSKAITDLDPRAAMYGFLNMMQVVRNLSSLMTMLKDSTGAAPQPRRSWPPSRADGGSSPWLWPPAPWSTRRSRACRRAASSLRRVPTFCTRASTSYQPGRWR